LVIPVILPDLPHFGFRVVCEDNHVVRTIRYKPALACEDDTSFMPRPNSGIVPTLVREC